MDSDIENVGLRLKKVRKLLKIRKDVFAKTLNIDETSLSDYEKGKKYPPFEFLRNISAKYNVSMEYMNNGMEEPFVKRKSEYDDFLKDESFLDNPDDNEMNIYTQYVEQIKKFYDLRLEHFKIYLGFNTGVLFIYGYLLSLGSNMQNKILNIPNCPKRNPLENIDNFCYHKLLRKKRYKKMNRKKEILFKPVADGVYVVETFYLDRPGFACCYVMVEGNEAAVIETNTNHAAPLILGTLDQLGIERNQVKYVILTHIHLDHAGGTGELMKNLPGAKLILHPRGKKHMIDPEKLIESVKKVYGEEQYKEFYGDIIPVPKEAVIAVNNGDSIRLGDRELVMFDTPGHAKHHIIIFDKKTKSVFSGDNFGIAYPRFHFGTNRVVFPSTSPTQFEPDKAIETYQKIIDLEPSHVLLTHYGAIEDLKGTHEQLKSWIEFSVEIAGKRFGEGYRNEELSKILEDDLWARFEQVITDARGYALTPEEKEWLALDTELNAQGIALYIDTPIPEMNK